MGEEGEVRRGLERASTKAAFLLARKRCIVGVRHLLIPMFFTA